MSLRRALQWPAVAALATLCFVAGCPLAPTETQPGSFLAQFSPPPDTTAISDTNPDARSANLLNELFSNIATNEYSGELSVATSDGTAINIVPPPSERVLPTGQTLAQFYRDWTAGPEEPLTDPTPPPPPLPPPSVLGPPGTVFSGTVAGNSREILIDVGEANIPDRRSVIVAFDADSGVLVAVTIPGNILVPDIVASFDGVGDSSTHSGVASNYPLSYALTATLVDVQVHGDSVSASISITLSATFGAAAQIANGECSISMVRNSSSADYSSLTRYAGTLSASAEGQPAVSFDFIQELTLAGVLSAD